MKVRQDPSALPGYNGKKGGERFRTILKYPIATDMAMKRYRVKDAMSGGNKPTSEGNYQVLSSLKVLAPHGTRVPEG